LLVLGVDGFVFWNLVPFVAASGCTELIVRLKGGAWAGMPISSKVCAICAAIGFDWLPIFFFIAWVADLGGTHTGSSTSALALIFVPMWSLVFGIVGAVAGLLAGHIVGKRMSNKFMQSSPPTSGR
jgi:hypothetical protein